MTVMEFEDRWGHRAPSSSKLFDFTVVVPLVSEQVRFVLLRIWCRSVSENHISVQVKVLLKTASGGGDREHERRQPRRRC
jgi:hypothetical protein